MLDWPQRFNIINGMAQGTLYLHQDSRLQIIHRDLTVGRKFVGSDSAAKTKKVDSNMIYLDSLAGVGMSYSSNKSDYTTMDTKTALDSHKFFIKNLTVCEIEIGISAINLGVSSCSSEICQASFRYQSYGPHVVWEEIEVVPLKQDFEHLSKDIVTRIRAKEVSWWTPDSGDSDEEELTDDDSYERRNGRTVVSENDCSNSYQSFPVFGFLK
ncbi:G-type lectin S-receptor-like serine/threonine-protein kinase [Tanacetum coccineum]